MKNRFEKRIHLTTEMLQKIAQIDELKGLWRGSEKMSPHVLNQLKSSVIITSTGSSTRIEGSKMSDEEVARLIRGLKSKPPKGRDAEEVAGYADLLGRIFDNYKTLKLNEGQILQFHEILLQICVNVIETIHPIPQPRVIFKVHMVNGYRVFCRIPG